MVRASSLSVCLCVVLGGIVAEKPHVCSAPLGGQEGRPSDGMLADYEILQVQVVTRHGARSPYHSLPNQSNPHHFVCQLHGKEEEVARRWPELFRIFDDNTRKPLDPQPPLKLGGPGGDITCALGDLLLEGVKQTRAIGAHLREAYGDFLVGLAPSQIYARTENIPRVVISSVSLLSGLLLGASGNGQPSAEQYSLFIKQPDSREPMNGLPCAAGTALQSKADQEYQYPKSALKKLGKLFALQEFSPYMDGIDPAIADVTYTALCDNGEFPCGPGGCVDEELQRELEKLYNGKWCAQFDEGDGLEASKLLTYPLIEEVVQLMSGEERPRFALFTGRDLVVGPVASALGFFDRLWPPFASHIVFELWGKRGGDSDSLRVRVLYDGADVTARIAGCAGQGELCPLATFTAAVQGMLAPHTSHAEACVRHASAAIVVASEHGFNGGSVLGAMAAVLGVGLAAALALLARSRASRSTAIEQPLLHQC